MEALLSSTAVVALAEIGDKTQLLALVLAAKYRRPLPIIAGIFVATVLNHALASAVGSALASSKLVDRAFDWGTDRPPAIPWSETVIYEAHVKGLTMRHPDVPADGIIRIPTTAGSPKPRHDQNRSDDTMNPHATKLPSSLRPPSSQSTSHLD